MSYTKGPWKWVRQNNRVEIIPDRGDEYYSAIAHVYATGVVNGNHYNMPVEANAAILASSPEQQEKIDMLLAACKAALTTLESDRVDESWNEYPDATYHEVLTQVGDTPVMIKLRAAITRAEEA